MQDEEIKAESIEQPAPPAEPQATAELETQAPVFSVDDFAPPAPQPIKPGKKEAPADGGGEAEPASAASTLATAKVLVTTFGMVQKMALSAFSGDSPDRYALTDRDKKDLQEPLVEYLELNPLNIPPWLAVFIAFGSVLGTNAYRAFEDRKRIKAMAKPAAQPKPLADQKPKDILVEEAAKPVQKRIFAEELRNCPELKADRRNFKPDQSGEWYERSSDNKTAMGPTGKQTDPNPKPSKYFFNFYEKSLAEALAKGLKTDVAHKAANKATRAECMAMQDYFKIPRR